MGIWIWDSTALKCRNSLDLRIDRVSQLWAKLHEGKSIATITGRGSHGYRKGRESQPDGRMRASSESVKRAHIGLQAAPPSLSYVHSMSRTHGSVTCVLMIVRAWAEKEPHYEVKAGLEPVVVRMPQPLRRGITVFIVVACLCVFSFIFLTLGRTMYIQQT